MVHDTRHDFAALFSLYLVVVVAVVAIVYGVVVFALVKYRRRPGALPRAGKDHPVVESLYAAGLAVIAAVLVAATFHTEDKIDPVGRTHGLRIEITAFQWGWRFDYPDLGVQVLGDNRAPPRLVVPVDTPIVFRETSRDVIHSFFVPALRFKRDAFPRRTTRFELTVAHRGVLLGRCAEFCGLHHADMNFLVDARDRPAFRSWVASHRRP